MKQGPGDNKAATEKNEAKKYGLNSTRNIIVLIVVAVIGVLILYNIYSVLFPSPKKSNKKDANNASSIVRPSKSLSSDNNFSFPKAPSAPSIVPPSIDNNLKSLPPPPAPLAPPPPPPPLPSFNRNGDENSGNFKLPNSVTQAVVEAASEKSSKPNQDAKRKAGIIAYGGGSGKLVEQDNKKTSSVVKTNAVTFKGDGRYLLVKGKIINATIESALDSTIGGDIRAIISNDVYSNSGRIVLIPRGSRLFGTYSSGVGTPLGRMQINWNRVDLPNGYTVDIMGSYGINNLAEKGVNGKVDRKIIEQLTSSILTSVVNIAVAKGLDIVSPPQSTTISAPNATAVSNAQTTWQAIAASGATSQNITSICNPSGPILTAINIISQSTAQSLTSICNSNNYNNSATQAQLTTIFNAFSTQISSLSATNSVTTTTSQTQAATQGAYQDFGNSIKNITKFDNFSPVVTIPQGTNMQIYVNEDFLFPSEAVYRAK